ncbi:MAG: outer membrane protein assembly factor BamA [Prevotellaceae bacterium]|jgi:outer membrane protein insertion porin family|nr:outer membrane protein assembly factor BamA [Prevotellaceae bacterium]
MKIYPDGIVAVAIAGKTKIKAGRTAFTAFCFVAGLLIFSNRSYAQQDTVSSLDLDYELPKKYYIAGISVSGITFADTALIINASGLKIGDVISSVSGDEKCRQAIKRLWSQNSYGSVDIQMVKTEDDKVWLDIILTERPRIIKWEIKGLKKSKTKDIMDILTFRRGGALSDYVIQSNVKKIKNYFAEKGYLNTDVKVSIKNDTILRNSVNIELAVKRNNKVKIKKITIEGNSQISKRKLKASMKHTKEKGFAIHSIFKSRKFVESKYEEDKDFLLEYYNRKGYRDAEILKDTTYKVSENRMEIKLNVHEGNRYYFRNISWVGNTKYPSEALDKVLRIKKGDVYDMVLLKDRLSTGGDESVMTYFYQDNGYLFSLANPVETNIIGDSIDVEIRIQEGEQARLSRITISGNTKTNEHVIRRELRTVPGDLFSISKYKESIRMLSTMKYFDAEELFKKSGKFIVPNQAENTADINYEVAEVSNDQFELSGGWGARMFVGSVGVTFNNFAASRFFDFKSWRPIPTGDGQTLSLRFQTNGKRYQQFSVSFMEPWLGGKKPINFSVSAYFSNQTSIYNPYYDYGYGYGSGYGYNYYYNTDSDESMKVIGLSTGIGHRLKWPDHNFTLSYNLTLQRYILKNWTGGFLFSNGSSNNFSLEFAFGRSSIFNPIFPRQGSSFSVRLKLTPPYSLFNPNKNYAEMNLTEKYRWIEYHKWLVDGSFFQPLVGEDLILMAKAQFGYLGFYNKSWGYSPFEGFIVGGGGMSGYVMYGQDIVALRGYEDNSLTPYNTSRNAYMGNVYNKYTLELRYPVIMQPASQIFVLGFLEGGNCWSSINQFNPFDIKRSVGLGVRVNLNIVGTLGLDWGYGLDKIEGRDMKRNQLHFVMGHTF